MSALNNAISLLGQALQSHLTGIEAKLDAILKGVSMTATQETELAASVAQLQTDVTAMITRVNGVMANLQASSVANDPAVDTAIQDLGAMSQTLEGFQVPVVPTPAPVAGP
jgi:hypothetical protein